MLTAQEKRSVRRAYKVLGWYDDAMEALYNDPMTHAMHAPVDDISDGWMNKYVRKLADGVRALNGHPRCERLRELLMDELAGLQMSRMP